MMEATTPNRVKKTDTLGARPGACSSRGLLVRGQGSAQSITSRIMPTHLTNGEVSHAPRLRGTCRVARPLQQWHHRLQNS